MKNLIKIVLLLLSLTLIFGLFACGGGSDPCTEHTDENSDGKCDKCGEKVDTPPCDTCIDSDGDGKCDECGEAVEPEPTADIPLIVDGEAKFQIVLAKNIGADVRKTVTKEIQTALSKDYKITVSVVTEGSKDDTPTDTEILIGNVTARGERYEFDGYSLGKKGYTVRMIDGKIIINAGSDETLVDTLEDFAEDVLGIGNKKIENVRMTSALEKTKIQNDYKLTLNIGGESLNGYTVAVDSSSSTHLAIARKLQDEIYTRVGFYLPIVKLSEASEKSVVIMSPEEKLLGEESFSVKVVGTQLVISSSFDNKAEDAAAQFILSYITTKTGEVNFSDTVYTEDISVVYYEDFGAVGNGRTNDYQAFYDAHAFANEGGQTVKGKAGRIYCLADPTVTADGVTEVRAIPIKTNVDWTGCEIIIDDTRIDARTEAGLIASRSAVFAVLPENPTVTIRDSAKLTALGKIGYTYNTEKIDLGLGYPAMLIVYNENRTVYRRYGASYSGEGLAQYELIVIDKDGNIDTGTPFMFDYDEITRIDIVRIDDAPITIKGGKVTSVATAADAKIQVDGRDNVLGYYSRGLSISRSNVTVDGLEHYITGEVTLEELGGGKEGAHYAGFYGISRASDITLKNCVMTARRNYGLSGTYEFKVDSSNNITLLGCVQSNFWIDADGNASESDTGRTSMSEMTIPNTAKKIEYCWGLACTDFSKNISYIDSRLSRFDAHTGIYNASIINSEVQAIEITGKGTFTMKDSKWYSPGPNNVRNSLIGLRGDYGSTWSGKIIIDSVTAYVAEDDFYVLRHGYANWEFGYSCHMPALEITDLMLRNMSDREDVGADYEDLNLFTTEGSMLTYPEMHKASDGNKNPIGLPEYIKIVSNEGGYKFKVPYQAAGEFLSEVGFYEGNGKAEYKKGSVGSYKFY